MKKKFLIAVLSTLSALSAFGLVACGGGGNSGSGSGGGGTGGGGTGGGGGTHTTHNYQTVEQVVQPTCTEDGYTIYSCSCGLTENRDVVPASHDFGSYTSDNNATYEADGTKTRRCNNCSESETIADEGSRKTRYEFEAVTIDGVEGYALTRYDATDIQSTEIEIPEQFDGKPVLAIKSFTGGWLSPITKVTIPNSVVEIYSNAFSGVVNLETLVIGTGLKTVGQNAFVACEYIKEVIYNGTADSWAEISFPDYSANPAGLAKGIKIGGEPLTELNLTSATKVGILAFQNILTLESVVLGDSVLTVEFAAFTGCVNLKSVVVGNEVTEIQGLAFSGCEKLSQVTLGDKVENIGSDAFEYCYALYKITLPQTLTTLNERAFKNCYKLIEIVNLSSLEITAGVGVAEYAKSVVTSEENSKISVNNSFVLYNDGSDAVLVGYMGEQRELTLPDFIDGSTYNIGAYAFYNSNITKVVMGEGAIEIGESAFNSCYDLQSVAIGVNVTTIGQKAFKDCFRLWDLQMANNSFGYGDKVEYISKYAFSCCNALTTISFPDVESLFVGNYAFEGCHIHEVSSLSASKSYFESNREKAQILDYDPVFNTPDYKDMDITSRTVVKDNFVFYKVNGDVKYVLVGYIGYETEVTLPTSVDGEKYYIADYAFRDYQGTGEYAQFVKVTIPDNAVTSIGDRAFENMQTLTEIYIGMGVAEIGEYAFSYCGALETLTLNEGLISIGTNAFEWCVKLIQVELPESVEIIAECAFNLCSNMESITIGANVTSIGRNSIYVSVNDYIINYNGTIAEWNAIEKADGFVYSFNGSYKVVCTDGEVNP